MNRIDSLYYILHIDNLDAILTEGILCRNKAPKNTEIHDAGVLQHRLEKKLPNGKILPNYVNLYFQPRNAMLYRLLCNQKYDKIVILQIKLSVLEQPDTWISDRNAAVNEANFFEANSNNFKKLDAKVFSNDFWADSDSSKQKMMAEALIPDKIPPEYIIGVYVGREDLDTKKKIRDRKPDSEDPKMFFLPQIRRRLSDKILLAQGDMFFSSMQTFTISVNTVGVMGKGLASRTKYQFPDAYVRYQDDCKTKKLKLGIPTLYKRGSKIEEELADNLSQLNQPNGSKWFLFLATKGHWSEDSVLSKIEQSMQWLVANYKKAGIRSIAMPALGCGLGKLEWKDVGPMMCHYLQHIDIASCIYLPMGMDAKNDYFASKEYLLGAAMSDKNNKL